MSDWRSDRVGSAREGTNPTVLAENSTLPSGLSVEFGLTRN
jgi:hypothetical protein